MKIKNIQKYLLLASFIGTFAEQMITPIYGMFVSKIGGNILDAGIGYAIFSILTGLIIILSSKIKWFKNNLELIVLIGFITSAFGDIGYYFVYNTITLFLIQSIIGISVGLLNPAWEALYTKSGEDGNEHEEWSWWGGGVNISIGISALIGALVTSYFGFGSMFLLTGVINSIAIFFSYLIYKNKKKINK